MSAVRHAMVRPRGPFPIRRLALSEKEDEKMRTKTAYRPLIAGSILLSALTLVSCNGLGGVPAADTSLSQPIGSLATFGHYGRHSIKKDYQTEMVLYGFGGSPDGSGPIGTLLNVGGTFYGMTQFGGASNNGTVFSITPSGTYNLLYSFAGGSDGAQPFGRLANVGGTLYGATQFGGASNDGTVFSITIAGAETVLHSFRGTDGANPQTGLTNVNTTLYGTTAKGGATGNGTVFKITTSGRETVLHSFTGSDGTNPTAELLKVGSLFYGTTVFGGAYGDGTIFTVSASGTETVLHSFSGSDGNYPNDAGGLIKVGTVLYGTTVIGGASNDGTIFKITTAGSLTSLYSFKGSPDGIGPYAGLTNLNGTLFGSTAEGGNPACTHQNGCGTLFALLPNGGPEIVVYSFTGGTDSQFPNTAMINLNGTLYGTNLGGVQLGTNGTVFSLSF